VFRRSDRVQVLWSIICGVAIDVIYRGGSGFRRGGSGFRREACFSRLGDQHLRVVPRQQVEKIRRLPGIFD
jgi:hypothetical protein